MPTQLFHLLDIGGAQELESFPKGIILKPLGLQVPNQLFMDLLPFSVPVCQKDHAVILGREVLAEFIECFASMDLENGAFEPQCPQAAHILIPLHNDGDLTIDFDQLCDQKLKLPDLIGIIHGILL